MVAKKIWMTVGIVLVVFSIGSVDASAKFMKDGNYWQTLEDSKNVLLGETAKVVFIRGIYDGVAFAGNEQIYSLLYMDEDDFILTVSDMLDGFYLNPENKKIPITQAIVIVTLDLRGSKNSVVQELTKKSRDIFNKQQ